MRPLVQDYVFDHSFAQLELEHGVRARFSQDLSKVALNYDQLSVKSGDLLAEQCRGMVIAPKELFQDASPDRIVGKIDVLAWPMDRFYNAGDPAAVDIDWNDGALRVLDKIDGTCCTLYFDTIHDTWHVATRSVSEADVEISFTDMNLIEAPGSVLTFSSLFKLAVEATSGRTWNDWTMLLDREKTYVFELTSPWNRIFIKYDVPRVALLAVRDLTTGEELHTNSFSGVVGVPEPRQIDISSLDHLITYVNMQDPARCEGVVVVDSKFRRLKVKNAQYVVSSRMKDALRVSRYAVLEQIILDKADDVLVHLEPSIAAKLRSMMSQYATFCHDIDASFVATRGRSTDRKSFALQIVGVHNVPSVFFGLFDDRAKSTSEWFRAQAECGKITRNCLDLIIKDMDGLH